MTTIDSTSSTSGVAPSPSSTKTTGFAADADLFLKMLTANLRNQDPMAPQDQSQQLAQMAQMTMVEQLTALSSAQKASNALNLLGKTVTYTTPDGDLATARVESVDVTGPSLKLEGVQDRILPEAVKEVVG